MENIKLLGSWEVITKQLIKRRNPLLVNDIHKSSVFGNKRLPFSKERLPIKSFLAVPLEKDNKVVGALIVSNQKRPGHLFTADDKKLMVALSNHIAIALLNARLYKNLKHLFISTIKSLVRAVEAKDHYTSGHSERVMKYAMAIGREMGIDEETLETLGLSSLLHDVGKIGIKDSLLSKNGKLKWSEMNEVTRHTTIGVNIVEGIEGSEKLVSGIRDHHEHFDGKGYPRRLKGNAISLAGRIITVADTYDALTTTRSYREKCSEKEAVLEIAKNSSTQFDPKVVKAFLRSFSTHNEIWKI
jgi:putative nucleotidyltransferase with HDIG domain